jgi:hypothetical protein
VITDVYLSPSGTDIAVVLDGGEGGIVEFDTETLRDREMDVVPHDWTALRPVE